MPKRGPSFGNFIKKNIRNLNFPGVVIVKDVLDSCHFRFLFQWVIFSTYFEQFSARISLQSHHKEVTTAYKEVTTSYNEKSHHKKN